MYLKGEYFNFKRDIGKARCLYIFNCFRFLRMNKSDRAAHLLTLVKSEMKKNNPIIIFGNRSITSDFISLFLNGKGVPCVNLNGDMLMKIRVGQFEKFQSGTVNALASTDIGSRGLDTTRVHLFAIFF